MACLFVYMNGYEVGEYVQHASGAEEFIYSDSWLEHEARAIPLSLSLPLTDKRHKGNRVQRYFANLLPENKNIRARIQAGFGAKTEQPFDLLSAIGRDCAGAIQLLTERGAVDIKKIEGAALSHTQIAAHLRTQKTVPFDPSNADDFRISLAGVQEKTALLRHQGKWYRPRAATPTTHIFKLPIGRIEHNNIDLSKSVENEWLCLAILREFGLPVANAQIGNFNGLKALIVERFDRELAKDGRWIMRLPQEDLCQANGIAPGLKYESDGGPGISSIMNLLKSSIMPKQERRQFMQTIFLFWLLGAVDGHAKNFSIYLKQGGRFNLTPVYDVISAYPVCANRQLDYQKLTMAMALRGKNAHYRWQEIMPRHWLSQSRQVNFPKSVMREIIEDSIGRLEQVITQVSSRLPQDFPTDIAGPVFDYTEKAAKRLKQTGLLENHRQH